jgi:hypothetical protein
MANEILPNPPAHLPKALQIQWSKNYAAALKQAMTDIPADESGQRTAARREANKLLRVPKPETHKDAAALVEAFQSKSEDGWKIIAHGRRKVDGVDHLSIVTADGQKYLYPVPAEKRSAKSNSDSK